MEMKGEQSKVLVSSIIVILIFILSGCNSKNQSNMLKQKHAEKCVIDSLINDKLLLNDSTSFNKYLLKDKEKVFYDDWIYFSSKDRTQYIGLQLNFGGKKDEYKQFEVGFIEENIDTFMPDSVKDFFEINNSGKSFSFMSSDLDNPITGKGIKLGISESELLQILKDVKLEKSILKDRVIYSYYNYDCLYESSYIFENNKLTTYRFGYITP